MFYKFENGQLVSGSKVTSPNYVLTTENKDTYTLPIDGWHWFDIEEDAQVLLTNLDSKQQLEYNLKVFGDARDVDLAEVGLLLTCGDPLWEAQASLYKDLYLLSWQNFEKGLPLPELTWGSL